MNSSYRNALIGAIGLHLLLLGVLSFEPSHQQSALSLEAKNDAIHGQSTPLPEALPIKAVSVDSSDIMETVNRLKQERLQQKQAEEARQKNLEKQAELARKERVQEQQRLQNLKMETEKLAVARKKQLEEEKRHLKQLAEQKAAEERRLVEMKKQQKQEADKLAAIQKNQKDELARAMKEQQENKAALLKQQQARAQASAQQAANDAEKQAQIAGEVNKYKALIIAAISRQWILPDNTNSALSSQFHIRLAPNGAVLEVTLAKSSGDPVLDRSAQSAIYKASPLPVPADPETFKLFREISLTVRPENARG